MLSFSARSVITPGPVYSDARAAMAIVFRVVRDDNDAKYIISRLNQAPYVILKYTLTYIYMYYETYKRVCVCVRARVRVGREYTFAPWRSDVVAPRTSDLIFFRPLSPALPRIIAV